MSTTMTLPTSAAPASTPVGQPQGGARPASAATREAPKGEVQTTSPGFDQVLRDAQGSGVPPQALIDAEPSTPAKPEGPAEQAAQEDTADLPSCVLLPQALSIPLPTSPSAVLMMRTSATPEDLTDQAGGSGNDVQDLAPTSTSARTDSGRGTAPGWLTQAQTSALPTVGQDTLFTGSPATRPLLGATPTPREPLSLTTPADIAASTKPSSTDTAPSWSAVLADLSTRPAEPATSLKLPPTTPTQWREPLLNSLGEKVQWQTQRGVDQAVIRLEPPQLGRVDIVIRQEAGALQVHISATHRDVMQQLQGVSDQLRQDLTLRHAGEVSVQLSDQMRHGDGRQRQGQDQAEAQRTPGRALADTSEGGTSTTAFATFHEQA